jgi:hypothetical protein
LTDEELRRVRPFLTAQSRQALSGINVNTAKREVLEAVIIETGAQDPCLPDEAAIAEISRAKDSREPIENIRSIPLSAAGQDRGAIQRLLTVRSSLFRIEASAVVNLDPERPEDFGGVAQTLSLLVHRNRDRRLDIPNENTIGWTLRAVDWQKEGGARLFLDPDGGDEEGEGEEEDEDFLPPLEEDR